MFGGGALPSTPALLWSDSRSHAGRWLRSHTVSSWGQFSQKRAVARCPGDGRSLFEGIGAAKHTGCTLDAHLAVGETLTVLPRPCSSATCGSGRDAGPSSGERPVDRERPRETALACAAEPFGEVALETFPCGRAVRLWKAARVSFRGVPSFIRHPPVPVPLQAPGPRRDLGRHTGMLPGLSPESAVHGLKGLVDAANHLKRLVHADLENSPEKGWEGDS